MADVSFEIMEFLRAQRFALLATHSQRFSGFPFGSVAPYFIEEEHGRILILVASIAEHYKNLVANPRAGLLVVNPATFGDPQANPRVTVLLELKEERDESLLQKFLERHPVDPGIAHSFRLFSGVPEAVRWIAGFGEMGWLNKEDFRALMADRAHI